VPTTFVILRNQEYGVLKWFATVMKATDLPGLDLPGIDYCAIANGYGVPAVRIATRDELSAALVRSIASDSPSLTLWRCSELASFAFCKGRTGLHCFRTVSLTGDGLSPFLALRGWS
jgi:thiamine pyrophosphate-dependent acetolactate synthase large subunit-like protein